MCGRYTNTRTSPQDIAARFEITISDATAERAVGRTNIAPTQPVLAVVHGENGERQAILARFGLAPAWAKLRGGPSLINTRDDKLASSGAWKPLVKTAAHRGLIVADGYYEWQKPEDPKQPRQPFYHRLPGGSCLRSPACGPPRPRRTPRSRSRRARSSLRRRTVTCASYTTACP